MAVAITVAAAFAGCKKEDDSKQQKIAELQQDSIKYQTQMYNSITPARNSVEPFGVAAQSMFDAFMTDGENASTYASPHLKKADGCKHVKKRFADFDRSNNELTEMDQFATTFIEVCGELAALKK